MIITYNLRGKLISCKINDASFQSSPCKGDTAAVLIVIYHYSHDSHLASCHSPCYLLLRVREDRVEIYESLQHFGNLRH